MWWIWIIVAAVFVIILIFLFLMGLGLAKMADESNCARLRRLGEREDYKK
jgi:hypothetical protein